MTSSHNSDSYLYGREGDSLTLTLSGDVFMNRRISVCEFDKVTSLIEETRKGDVGILNLESILNDGTGIPSANSGGTYARSFPWVADELEYMGFDLFSLANNHIGDYSYGGMRKTMEILDQKNIDYAGLGENLDEARYPEYRDTPAGRVALISASVTFPPGFEAGKQRPEMKGRPGIFSIRLNTKYIVDEEHFQMIQKVGKHLGMDNVKQYFDRRKATISESENEYKFIRPKSNRDNLTIEKGDNPGMYLTVNDSDLESLKEMIRMARRQADWVVVSIHNHEGENGTFNDKSNPEFMEKIAHESVDNGADVFVSHGPHVLRGIEIYNNAPIFYSLGNLFYEIQTIERLPNDFYEVLGLDHTDNPADLYDEVTHGDIGTLGIFLANRDFWESVVARCEFNNGKLSQIELIPIDLGLEAPRQQRGRPFLARESVSKRVVSDLQSLSDPYGTDIQLDDNRGFIKI